jgi:hypothetical protein
MATGRPLVFSKLVEDQGKVSQNPFGYTVSGRASLVKAVTLACEEQDAWRSRIEQACSAALYNPGNAADYISAHLPIFAARQSASEWLSIPRTPWCESSSRDEHLARVEAWSLDGPSVTTMRREISEYLAKL